MRSAIARAARGRQQDAHFQLWTDNQYSQYSNSAQLFEEHEREYQALVKPGPLKIGVQIRAGDHRMGEGAVSLPMFAHFFDCASQIEVRNVAACTDLP